MGRDNRNVKTYQGAVLFEHTQEEQHYMPAHYVYGTDSIYFAEFAGNWYLKRQSTYAYTTDPQLSGPFPTLEVAKVHYLLTGA